nr:serine/threonine-protein kinase 25 isoform X2 [Arachis hypogaea]
MSPEVIQESRYDGKVDVWVLGVSAIEMAEGVPPRSSVHPMRVSIFHDFVAKCLTKEPRLRPTESEMLKGINGFLAPTPLEDEPMVTSMLNDEYGDTVPSGHQNLAVQEATDLSSSGGVREDDGGEELLHHKGIHKRRRMSNLKTRLLDFFWAIIAFHDI